jgi:hypothetical protein
VLTDWFFPARPKGTGEGEGGGLGAGGVVDPELLRGKKPVLRLQYRPSGRFGLVMLGVKDPRPEYKDRFKRLTADEMGGTNNTRVKIAGFDYLFGTLTPQNRWFRNHLHEDLPEPRIGRIYDMLFRGEKVRVTQRTEIVPGQTGLLDTCLVYYRIYNYGEVPRKVGLRVMLDTYIGANDGVPFTVPGRTGFVTKGEEFKGSAIPDYIEAIEKPDNPKDPGTTVRLGLKGIKLPDVDLDEPDRLRITRYPGNPDIGWDVDLEDIGDDSCVALYWDPKELAPGEKRYLAFTYGLSKLEVGDLLALSCPGSVLPGREFVVTAYVWNAKKGQKVTIELPEGLRLAPGQSPEKTVEEGAARSQVFWRVRAGKTGTYTIKARSESRKAQPRSVQVKATSIFG